jgi:hypothetical protein
MKRRSRAKDLYPFIELEKPIRAKAGYQHKKKRQRVPILPVHFRLMLKVHAINS